SGPTAAFVVILLPITQQYGLGGLLLCTMLAGLILIALGLLRAGKLISFVPYPVTLGFTAGIGIVIATLQIKDFLGLRPEGTADHYVAQVMSLAEALPSFQVGDALVGLVTLGVLIVWPRFVPKVPGHLVALLVGTLLGLLLEGIGLSLDTLGERFSYTVDGIEHPGIPPFLPSFAWPWSLPGPDGQPLMLSFELIRQLAAPAFAIAMLGAIESLLCAVVADGMAGTKHDPNAELLGQGIGNLVAPLFGGITATAALARTATNVKAGAFSPLSGIVHAGVVLLAMLLLAPLFSYLPMSALAALLLMVAWNMSEAHHVVHAIKVAPRRAGAAGLPGAHGAGRHGAGGGCRTAAGRRPVHQAHERRHRHRQPAARLPPRAAGSARRRDGLRGARAAVLRRGGEGAGHPAALRPRDQGGDRGDERRALPGLDRPGGPGAHPRRLPAPRHRPGAGRHAGPGTPEAAARRHPSPRGRTGLRAQPGPGAREGAALDHRAALRGPGLRLRPGR